MKPPTCPTCSSVNTPQQFVDVDRTLKMCSDVWHSDRLSSFHSFIGFSHCLHCAKFAYETDIKIYRQAIVDFFNCDISAGKLAELATGDASVAHDYKQRENMLIEAEEFCQTLEKKNEDLQFRLSQLKDEGTMEAIIQGMWQIAENHGHSQFAARHAMKFISQRLSRLQSQVEDLTNTLTRAQEEGTRLVLENRELKQQLENR